MWDVIDEKDDIELISVEEAAKLMCIGVKTLRQRSYRERIGLPGYMIGRKLIFARADVLNKIRESREVF